MRHFCIGELAEIVGGALRLGLLPPLAGPFEPIRRIVVESREAGPGDVYWALAATGYQGAYLAEDAYLRGALGVVASGRHVEPWAGKFSLHVPDANAALQRFAAFASRNVRRRPVRQVEEENSTEMVRAMLQGCPVGLEELLDRVTPRATALVACS
jgi:UDP-N-acetylmuramyl pentapeptide synthase